MILRNSPTVNISHFVCLSESPRVLYFLAQLLLGCQWLFTFFLLTITPHFLLSVVLYPVVEQSSFKSRVVCASPRYFCEYQRKKNYCLSQTNCISKAIDNMRKLRSFRYSYISLLIAWGVSLNMYFINKLLFMIYSNPTTFVV